jgi:thiol-disulfide isomerase/thioredoxin
MCLRTFRTSLSIGLCLAAAVAITYKRPWDVSAAIKGAKDRNAAPDFTLKDAKGADVKLSEYKGIVVLLNFWATWCGPCEVEIPWFTEFANKYEDRGLMVLGVAVGYPRPHHVGTVETGAKRSIDVRWLETAAGDFCQHRRKQEGIALAEEGEAYRDVCAKLLLQVLGRRHPGEPTAEDYNPDFFGFGGHRRYRFGPQDLVRNVAQGLHNQSEGRSV